MKMVGKYRKLIIFSLNQLMKYMDKRNDYYKNNSELMNNKPIVYRENLAVYEEERLYLGHTIDLITEYDYKSFKTPEDYRDYILSNIEKFYNENGIPKVCYVILKEKLELCLEFLNSLLKD